MPIHLPGARGVFRGRWVYLYRAAKLHIGLVDTP